MVVKFSLCHGYIFSMHSGQISLEMFYELPTLIYIMDNSLYPICIVLLLYDVACGNTDWSMRAAQLQYR